MKMIEAAAEEYQSNMRKVGDAHVYNDMDIDVARYVAFKAGSEWMLNNLPMFFISPCEMPEELNFKHHGKVDENTIYASTKEYIIFYKHKGYDIAYREWSKDDPVWRWRVKYGTIVDDEDILCWMQKE